MFNALVKQQITCTVKKPIVSSTLIHTFGRCSKFTVSFYEIYAQNFLKGAQYITYVKVTLNFSTKMPYKTKQRLPCADVNLRFLQLLRRLPCRTRVNRNIKNTLFLNKKNKGLPQKGPRTLYYSSWLYVPCSVFH